MRHACRLRGRLRRAGLRLGRNGDALDEPGEEHSRQTRGRAGARTRIVDVHRWIRIITAGMSPLLGDMVTQVLAGRWHINSITRLETCRDLTKYLAGMLVDLIIVGRDGGGSETVTFGLLTTYPDVSVLELSADGRMAWLHRAGALPLALDLPLRAVTPEEPRCVYYR